MMNIIHAIIVQNLIAQNVIILIIIQFNAINVMKVII